MTIEIISESELIKSHGRDYWKTEISPSTKAIAQTSEEGKKLGLTISVLVGDRYIFTKEKVR